MNCEVIDARGEEFARICNIQRYSLIDVQGIR
ncbi:[formate-C-acetyltransferase]-activating enzyme, partial [Citrobacter portucalensis]